MGRNRKAISEIVAALILVSIVVAGGIIVYVYSSGLLGSLLGAGPQQGQYTNQITLEFYDWTSCTSPCSTSTLTLTLRNVGSGRAVLAAFYVEGKAVQLKVGGGSTCTVTTSTLLPRYSCAAVLDISFQATAGVAYIVKVVTSDGGVFSYSCIAGQRTGSF